ncbi:MAG: nuclease-related domain-containing protein, partial [Solirubrobacterales bacterium]
LHGRVIADTEIEIDHVFVARSGVTVIDVKNFNYAVEIEQLVGWASDTSPPNLLINGQSRRDLIDSAVVLREAVAPIAAAAISSVDVPVHSALSFIAVAGVDRTAFREIRGVYVETPEKLAEHLLRRGPLLDDEIAKVADYLDETLPRR